MGSKIGAFTCMFKRLKQIAGLAGFADEDGDTAAGGDFGEIDFRSHAAGTNAGASASCHAVNLIGNFINFLIFRCIRRLAWISRVQTIRIGQDD